MNAEGYIESFEIAKNKEGKTIRGAKKNGEEWSMFKYKIGGHYYSGFLDLTEVGIKIGEYVSIDYEEKSNPNNPNAPYRNVSKMTEAVAPEEVSDANKEYNVEEVGQKPERKMPEQPAFFGMVSNQAMEYIIHKQQSKGEFNYQENFSQIFDIIWEENIKKRKEKLNY